MRPTGSWTGHEAPAGGNTALRTILADPVLLQAGAWLAGFFRRHSGATVGLPLEELGFQERLHDIPIPPWPYPCDEVRSRDVLNLFVRAGLLSGGSAGNFREVAEGHDLLEAFTLYHFRDVEKLTVRFPSLTTAAEGRRVLDAGCGVGAYALYYRDLGARTIIALDCSRQRLAVTNRFATASGGRVVTVQGSVERLPLPDASVDLIHSRVVLPYVHQRRTIAEFARVLSGDGHALLMLHSASFYGWQLREIGLRWSFASDAALALMGLAGGAAFSLLGFEPHWPTLHERRYLSYQSRRAFARLVESNGFRVDGWDTNHRKPIAWLSKSA